MGKKKNRELSHNSKYKYITIIKKKMGNLTPTQTYHYITMDKEKMGSLIQTQTYYSLNPKMIFHNFIDIFLKQFLIPYCEKHNLSMTNISLGSMTNIH